MTLVIVIQGDQMLWTKNGPKRSQNLFLSKLTHKFYRIKKVAKNTG
jgi:hypothetical protein